MPIDPHIAASVRDIVGAENFLDHPAETQSYGFNSYPAFTEPGAVVMLRDVEQVQRVVAMLYDRDVPMVIRGSGTNVCGSALTAKGGVVLSLERMTRILELDTVSRFAVVEAGASVDQLQKLAIENGLLFTPNPGNVAAVTVGGIIGCNSSGDLALSYGTTRDFVLGLDLVIHDGSLIRLGARCRKDVTGYDLVRLVVGSEGTLGVVTQATLKLVDKPEAETSVLVGYDEEQVGAEACLALLEERLSPVALEFMDNQTLRAVEAAFKIGIPDRAKAVVLARFFGTREATAAAARRAEAVLVRAGGFYSTTTAPGESAEHLWRARHWAYPALARICPTLYGEDICVPVRHFP
ncbi:MAG TPA: FAD-binding oxidoreductase, partial [Kofleriaceae bacterium]|nr:FAD-binding oxidoreductase [Kofleriaceae bacterium]